MNTTLNYIVDLCKNLSAIAVILAGCWKIYEYILCRTYSERLGIDASVERTRMNEKWIVSVEVVLKNNGKGKIQAWSGGDGKLAYKDALEELKRPCSLQLKRISSTVEQDNQYLNWYNSASLVSVPDIPSEINLLDDYVMTDDHNRVEFWLESGDTVHLPATLILNPGNYLGKISFYGRKPKKDFWTRFVFLNLEECGTTA